VVELELEDWQALGKLANSAKWTLRHKKSLGRPELPRLVLNRWSEDIG
jgi:hypothetical protein